MPHGLSKRASVFNSPSILPDTLLSEETLPLPAKRDTLPSGVILKMGMHLYLLESTELDTCRPASVPRKVHTGREDGNYIEFVF